MPDELFLYVSGRYVPKNAAGPGAPQVDTTGLAKLRRDGFASLTVATEGAVTTRALVWSTPRKYLFTNFAGESLRVSVRDASTGREIAPFTLANSYALTNDTTRAQMHWKGEGADFIKNEELCIKNEECFINNDEFCR